MPMRGLLVACLVAISPGSVAGTPAASEIVTLNMKVTLDRIAPGLAAANHVQVGDIDHMRISYDAKALDPRVHRVVLRNFQHLMNGKYLPEKPDPASMPVDDSWLDLASQPYKLHFRAAVVRDKPIIISADETTRRFTIASQADPNDVILSGIYEIDSSPVGTL